MKANTAIAIVAAPVVLLLAVIMEGGNPMGLLNIPALIVVMGGTSMAVLASFTFPQFMAMPKLMILAMTGGKTPE
jgi:flagellar motor component MotA